MVTVSREQAIGAVWHRSALGAACGAPPTAVSGQRGATGPEDGTQARRAPWQTQGQRHALVAIKLVHSVIFLVNTAAILHLLVAGLRDRPSRWTTPALAAALAESAVFVANRGRCPLTDLAEHLGAADGRVSDIFLPRWCADRIPLLCTPLLLVGLLSLVLNAWRHAAHRHQTDQPPGSDTAWIQGVRAWRSL